MSPVLPRIINDVSYVSRINHEIHFAWQVQCLVKLDGVLRCFALLRALEMTFHM